MPKMQKGIDSSDSDGNPQPMGGRITFCWITLAVIVLIGEPPMAQLKIEQKQHRGSILVNLRIPVPAGHEEEAEQLRCSS